MTYQILEYLIIKDRKCPEEKRFILLPGSTKKLTLDELYKNIAHKEKKAQIAITQQLFNKNGVHVESDVNKLLVYRVC